MSGVRPVANRASFYLSRGIAKSVALLLLGSVLSAAQPSQVAQQDAVTLLGLDGGGAERWRTFLVAAPAGSVHEATLYLNEESGSALGNTGIGQFEDGALRLAALGPGSLAGELITGSLRNDRLPEGPDPLIARDTRQGLVLSPVVHAMQQARRAPVSMYEVHPFARLELASLPTDGFSGYIGMIAPPGDVMLAEQSAVEAIEGLALGGSPSAGSQPGDGQLTGDVPSPYLSAMLDPSAGSSPLREDDSQRQISAFLGNDRQFQCLAEGVYFEARGEPRQGQVAVAQVIMNRVNHEEFPDTICGVVYQNQTWRNRCQFSFACDGVPERITEPAAWAMAEDVSRQVLEGRDLIESITESTHYHAGYVRPRWAPRMIRLDRIGLHIFYKGRYGGWR